MGPSEVLCDGRGSLREAVHQLSVSDPAIDTPLRTARPEPNSRGQSMAPTIDDPVRGPQVIVRVPEPRKDSAKDALAQAPSAFFCPISMELMTDPVVLPTGHTYERICIERWFRSGERSCPNTGSTLEQLVAMPNVALRQAIQVWRRTLTANGITGSCQNTDRCPAECVGVGSDEWCRVEAASR